MRHNRKLLAATALDVDFGFVTEFAGECANAETKYKEPAGITLPTVEHNRKIDKTGECGEGLSYVLDDGTLTVSGTGKIADNAFRDVSAIRKVVINEGVSDIGVMAFSDTWNIVGISFPKSVKTIGDAAFSVCRSLESVSIPEGVASIGEKSFSCCFTMNELSIPNTLTDIGKDAFYGCVSLERIVVSDNNPVYDSRKGCNALIDSKSNELLVGCRSTVIPDGITTIGKYAYTGIEGLTDVVVPDSVKVIGKSAFYFCVDLKNVYIPSSVVSIGENAFSENNKNLEIHTKKDSYAWNYALEHKIAKLDTGKTDELTNRKK
ncbi:MAG: leucine-rich repeat domain-containing protein [Lachnospiraceae bacterium]|nr:leucine-rich repeat domain-containing protein [Lachnospiraceae bacterium]